MENPAGTLPPIAATAHPANLEELSMFPLLREEVETSLRKEGISFIFESRSVSAVLRYIYTPIEGTFADIELEINKTDPLKPADEGGIDIAMGNQVWPAASEEVERHFVSCEQLGDSVEARWQWKSGEEVANFLYRLRLVGKSLVVEVEGGNGKATGLSLGRVSGALHPRLIGVPYFNLGDHSPQVLCASGVFVSSLIDWFYSSASSLYAPPAEEARRHLKINGGCTYLPKSDGRRNPLQERWLLTTSVHFEEVLPTLSAPESGQPDSLSEWIWYNLSFIAASEESYVEIFERLRLLKQMGLDHLLINHPADTWHDGEGNATLHLEGAPAKGGDDALLEYLEALGDLGYKTSLYLDYREMAAANSRFAPELAAHLSDGHPSTTAPDRYLLKPDQALALAAEHTRAVADKYHNDLAYLGAHAGLPPWAFNDYDHRAEGAARLAYSFRAQHSILAAQGEAQRGPVVGQGGCHWLYPGLLNGYLACLPKETSAQAPLLLDFDLLRLHPLQSDAGLGAWEEFLGKSLPSGEKHSRSASFDRYLATLVAFGHAGLLPEPDEWGLPAVVKTYFLLQKVQGYYLRVPVTSIRYHHEGHLLETNDALLSGAYEWGQVHIAYASGLEIHAHIGREGTWTVPCGDTSYTLSPGSFLARGPDDLLVYSADPGAGRIDYASCGEYFYCDARGQVRRLGPLRLDGAAVVLERKWEIDVVPLECRGDLEIDVAFFWPDRRLPPLRLLAYRTDAEEPDVYRADMDRSRVRLRPSADIYKYRITLPEWMVEPGH
jgi:hypothetical protein